MAGLVLSISVDDKGTPKVKAFIETVQRSGPALNKSGSAARSHGQELDRLGLMASGAGNKLRSMALGYLASAAAAAAATLSIRSVIAATIEQDRVSAQLQARLISTGGAVGYTHGQLKEMASEYQRLTTFGDEAVMSAEAILIQFKRLGHDVFPEAIKQTLNLAEALQTQPSEAAAKLGRAMNDPIAGLRTLRAAGVQFTESQKSQLKVLVESGRVYEAQKIILKQLEHNIGGAAEAARGTLGGALKALKNSWGDLHEVEDTTKARAAIEGLNATLKSSSFKKWADSITSGIMHVIEGFAEIPVALDAITPAWNAAWASMETAQAKSITNMKNQIDTFVTGAKVSLLSIRDLNLSGKAKNLADRLILGAPTNEIEEPTSAAQKEVSALQARMDKRAAEDLARINKIQSSADASSKAAMERYDKWYRGYAANMLKGKQGVGGLTEGMNDGADAAENFDAKLHNLTSTLAGLESAASLSKTLNSLRVRAGEMSDESALAKELGFQRDILAASIEKARYESEHGKDLESQAKARQEVLNLTNEQLALPEIERLNAKINANKIIEAQQKATNDSLSDQAKITTDLTRLRNEAAASYSTEYQDMADLQRLQTARLAAISEAYDLQRAQNDAEIASLETSLSMTKTLSDRIPIIAQIKKINAENLALPEERRLEMIIQQNNALEEQKRLYADRASAYEQSLSEGFGAIQGPLASPAQGVASMAGNYAKDSAAQNAGRLQLDAYDQQLAQQQTYSDRYMEIVQQRQQLESSLTQQHASTMAGIYAVAFGSMSQTIGAYMDATGKKSVGLLVAMKTLAVMQAMMQAYQAYSGILANTASTPGLGMAALPTATTMANIALGLGLANAALIAATPIQMHEGGVVYTNPGVDETDRRLQRGEGVINRRGMALLDAINSGSLGKSSAASKPSVNVHIHNETGGEVEQRTRDNGDGTQDIFVRIKREVADDIANGGQISKAFQSTYGVRRQTRQR